MLNVFGRHGGYDEIISKILNKDQIISFELLYHYVDIVGKNYLFFHKDFALKYFIELFKSVR